VPQKTKKRRINVFDSFQEGDSVEYIKNIYESLELNQSKFSKLINTSMEKFNITEVIEEENSETQERINEKVLENFELFCSKDIME